MRFFGSILSAVLVLPFCAASISAQQTGDVSPEAGEDDSTLVRVTAPTVRTEPAVGTLEEVADDSLTVRLSETAVASIPRGAITKLEMSTGRSGHPLRGAAVGLNAGTIAFLTSLEKPCSTCQYESSISTGTMTGIALGGAAVGALIGSSMQTRNWEDVTVESLRERDAVSFSVGVNHLGVSILF